jgi:hypothetical protein
MCLIFSFVPATFWAIVGYFVLFSSRKAEGRIKTLGQVLAIWTFVLAALIPIVAAYVTAEGVCPIDAIFAATD